MAGVVCASAGRAPQFGGGDHTLLRPDVAGGIHDVVPSMGGYCHLPGDDEEHTGLRVGKPVTDDRLRLYHRKLPVADHHRL